MNERIVQISHFFVAPCIFTITPIVCVLALSIQEPVEASYAATVKTIRQVKTVFIIFVAFVSCWSPYIIVLLYDTSDSFPLPIHLYASMLAHLHASLNFAIYGLMNPNIRTACVTHLFICCGRLRSSNNATAAATAVTTRLASRTGPACNARVDIGPTNRSLVTSNINNIRTLTVAATAAPSLHAYR